MIFGTPFSLEPPFKRKLLRSGFLDPNAALSLRGRMQFAKSQVWGRSSRLCLSAVTSHAYSGSGSKISDHLMCCVLAFRSSLKLSRPREITTVWDSTMFLFTDASFCPENDAWPCGLGGVLVDSTGAQVAALSVTLCLSDLHTLGYPEKSTVIFEAEMLAVVVCLKLWKSFLKRRPCVIFIDNNSARDVAISGSARTFPGTKLISVLLETEDSCGVNAFYARVPSESTIADNPSRDCLDGIHVKIASLELVNIVIKSILRKVIP